MKILILGGHGRIGSKLKIDGLRPTIGELDVTDFDNVCRYFEKHKPEVVINLAGEIKDEGKMYDVNVLGAENVAKACAKYGCKKLVHISSCAVYHQTSLDPTKEDENVNPQSEYGRTKLEGENRVLSVFDNTIVLRLFNVFGIDGDNVIDRLARGEHLKLIDGGYYRTWVSISIVEDAIVHAVESKLVGVYNVGGVCMNNRELVDWLETETGFEFDYEFVVGDPSYSWGDIMNDFNREFYLNRIKDVEKS